MVNMDGTQYVAYQSMRKQAENEFIITDGKY
jgi:hypothetical protein